MVDKKKVKISVKKGKHNLTDPVYFSFFASFLFLSGTTLITFLAALSANDANQVYFKTSFSIRNFG